MIDSAVSLFNQGELKEAISVATELVTNNPRSLEPRVLLAQLLGFTGNWERVKKISGQLKSLDSEGEHLALTNLLDAMATAEDHRASVWNDGAVPEFAQQADETTKKLLWAWNCRRSNKIDEYQKSLDEVLESSPIVKIKTPQGEFSGLRDLDDMTSTVIEAHSIYGAYYWLPLTSISKIEVSKPTRPMDFLWNSARIKFTNDSEARMYLCGTYFRSFGFEQDSFLLGRESEWVDGDDGIEIGKGRKIFVADEQEFTFFEFADVELSVEA